MAAPDGGNPGAPSVFSARGYDRDQEAVDSGESDSLALSGRRRGGARGDWRWARAEGAARGGRAGVGFG